MRLTKAALAEVANVQTRYITGLRRIDAKIALLAGHMPDKIAALRRKVQARIDRGSTEGERTAAREIVKRLPSPDVDLIGMRWTGVPRLLQSVSQRPW
jgi:hypothetical protein